MGFEVLGLQANTGNLLGSVLASAPSIAGGRELSLSALAVNALISVVEGLVLDWVLEVEMTLGNVLTHDRSITEIGL